MFSTTLSRSQTQLLFPGFSILTLVITVPLTARRPQNSNKQVTPTHLKSPSRTYGPRPATPHLRFATFLADGDYQSRLLLQNLRSDVPITATPTLIIGENELPLDPVTVAPNSSVTVDINGALGGHGYSGSRGTVAVGYTASSYGAFRTVVESSDYKHYIYLNSIGRTAEEFWSGTTLDVVVWAPNPGAHGLVVITNTSSQVRTVQATYTIGGNSRQLPLITLGPSRSELMPIDDLLSRSQPAGAGIHLAFTGNPGDIVAEGLLMDNRSGFSKTIHFMDGSLNYPTGVVQTNTLFLGVQPSEDGYPSGLSFRSVAVVRNIDSAPVQVTPTITFDDGSSLKSVSLDPLPLGINESGIIDFQKAQDAGVLPANFHQGSVQLAPSSGHNSLVAEMFNFDGVTGGYVVGSSFTSYASHGTGSVWRIDGTFQSLIFLRNEGTEDDNVRLQLFSGGTTYKKTFPVAPGALLRVSVKELQQDAVPDDSGRLLVSTSGTMSIIGSRAGRSKLSIDTLVHSSDESDYVGLPPNACDYVTGISMYIDFSGGQNLFPVMQTWNWSQSGPEDVAASGTTTNHPEFTTINNVNGADMATFNFSLATAGTELYFNDPTTGATDCDACSSGDFYPSGSAPMPLMARIHQGSCTGTDITGTTQSVVIGQQIVLCATYNLSSGTSVSSQFWSVAGGSTSTNVGGYNASTASASVVTEDSNSQSTTFYWVTPGTATEEFQIVASDGDASPPATTIYNIGAPNPSTPTVTLPTNGQLFVNTLDGCSAAAGGQFLDFGNLSGAAPGCGNPTGLAGIQFSPPTTQSPPGTFFFVQLVNSDTTTYSRTGATETCSTASGLDRDYPYQNKTGQLVNDAPEAPLPSTFTNATRSFNATMYLMWQSNTSGSIPAPLGYVDWQFSGSTSEPQQNSTWGSATGSGSAGNFVTATSPSYYPTWQAPATTSCQ